MTETFVDITKREWAVIEVGQEGLESVLRREKWTCMGFEVFAILSSPDRIVFRKVENSLEFTQDRIRRLCRKIEAQLEEIDD